MKNKTPMNVKIDGLDYAVALDWLECNKTDNLKNIYKREQKSKGSNCVSFESETNVFIGFSEENQVDKISLAAATALYERDCLYIYKVESVNKFWLNYVSPDGRLGAAMDDVLLDTDEVINIINNLLIIISSDNTSKLRIYSTSESIQELQESLDDDDKYRLFGDNKILIQSFDVQSITSGKVGPLARIAKVDSGGSISTLTAITMAVMVAVGGAVAYTAFSEDPDEYESLINGEYSKDVVNKEDNMKKVFDSQEKELFNSLISKNTKQEFIDMVESNTYELSEIISYLEMLSVTFPTYLVEWELKDISFKKGDDLNIVYEIPYTRITDSFGVYKEVEKSIEDIIKDIDSKHYEITSSDVGKNSILISIKFKEDFKNTSLTSIDNIKEEIKKETDKIDKKIKSIKDDIKVIEDDAIEFGFIQKRFGDSIDDSISQIEELSQDAISILKDKEKLYEKLFKTDKFEIPSEYYELTRDKFLNTIQENNHYGWTISGVSKVIPRNLADLEKQNNVKPKVSSSRRVLAKKAEVVENFDWTLGKSWDFTVASTGEGTNGIEGLRKLMELINNKSITIKEIKYNFNSENWSLIGEFYEKK